MAYKLETTEELKAEVEKVMNKNVNDIPQEGRAKIEEAVLRMVKENLTLAEVLEISPDLMDEMYDYGYRLYNSGKFKEALSFFEPLRQLDASDSRYTFAIAASQHLAKDYMLAAGNYMLYQALEPKNPLSYYHLYDCFTKMGQPILASNALAMASDLAKTNEEYAALNSKIDIELTRLKEEESKNLKM